MDREKQIETEIDVLRSLCDESVSVENRQTLAGAMTRHAFAEPEHQVVFESIRSLLARGPFTLAKLQSHLTNRGFPDTEIEKYFAPPKPGERVAGAPSDKLGL